MKKNITRSVLVTVAAGAVGAGSLLAAGQAHAAEPGDLKVTAAVVCDKAKNETLHLVSVENVGATKITGVRVGSVAGPEITVPEIAKGDAPVVRNGLLVGTNTGTGANGTLDAGQGVVTSQKFAGCGSPYAIVGYAIGNEIDNVFSAPNFDFDWGMAPPELKIPAQPAG